MTVISVPLCSSQHEEKTVRFILVFSVMLNSTFVTPQLLITPKYVAHSIKQG